MFLSKKKKKKTAVKAASGCLLPAIAPLLIVIVMLGAVGAAVDALCEFFSGLASEINDYITPQWVKDIDQNIKDSTCIDLDDLRIILNMECASYENETILITIGMNKSKDKYTEEELKGISSSESYFFNVPSAVPKKDDEDKITVPSAIPTKSPSPSTPPLVPGTSLEGLVDQPTSNDWQGKFLYDNREGTYQYRLPWQFVYATAVCMNMENFMEEKGSEPDMNKYSDQELENIAKTGEGVDEEEEEKEYIVKTEDLQLIKDTFDTDYTVSGVDYYRAYRMGRRSYSFDELSALPHLSRADGDILTPFTAYKTINTYLYKYKFSYQTINGNTTVKARQKIFSKEDFLAKMKKLGIEEKDMELIYFVLNKSYEGSAIADEISKALDGENGIVEQSGDTSDIDDDYVSDTPFTNTDDSIIIDKLEYPPGGLKVPLYYQNHNQPWSNNHYGDSNIADCGCCPTSMAMILSYYKQEKILPSDVVNWTGDRYYVKNRGSSWALMGAVSKHWGYDCKQIAKSTDVFKKYLDNKTPILIDVGPSEFTSGGHFMVIRGYTISNGKQYFLINDPAHRRKKTQNSYVKFQCSYVISVLKAAWVVER